MKKKIRPRKSKTPATQPIAMPAIAPPERWVEVEWLVKGGGEEVEDGVEVTVVAAGVRVVVTGVVDDEVCRRGC